MAGIVRVDVSLGVSGPAGLDGPFAAQYAQSVTKWTGKRHMTLATAITDQSLIDIGTGGLTTINAFMIMSDQAISVKFGAAGANVAVALVANAPLCLAGLSLTALSLSNASGNTAQVDYALAGA